MKDLARLQSLVAVSGKLQKAHELLCDLALTDLAASVRAVAEGVNHELAALTSPRLFEVVS